MSHLGLPFGFSSIWAGFDGSGLTTSRLQDKSVAGSRGACGWSHSRFQTLILCPLLAHFRDHPIVSSASRLAPPPWGFFQ